MIMQSALPETGVIVASPESLRSIVAQGVREGVRLALAEMGNDNRPMTEAEAAEYLQKTKGSLRVWRCRGVGPQFSKDGKNIWYRRKDLDDYLAPNRKHTMSSITTLQVCHEKQN